MATSIQNAMRYVSNPTNTKKIASDDVIVVAHIIKEFNKSTKKNAPTRFVVVPHRAFTLQEYNKKRKVGEIDDEKPIYMQDDSSKSTKMNRSHTFEKEIPFSVSSFDVDRKVSGKICKVELSNLKLTFWQPKKQSDEESDREPLPSVICDIKYICDDILDKSLTSKTLSVPKIEDLSETYKYTSITLPMMCESLVENYTCAAMPSSYIKDRDVFVREDKDTQEETIAMWQMNGYPFIVKQGDETLLAYVKIYDNNSARPESPTVSYTDFLSKFGISNVDNWACFAPKLLGNINGFIMGYFNNNDVRNWKQNQDYTADEDECSFKPSMKITLTATYLYVNIRDVVRRAGLKVEPEFVLEKFGGVKKLFSDDAELNYYYKNRKVLNKEFFNLNEINGDTSDYVNGEYDYYLVGDWDTKPDSIKDAVYDTWQIFSVKK